MLQNSSETFTAVKGNDWCLLTVSIRQHFLLILKNVSKCFNTEANNTPKVICSCLKLEHVPTHILGFDMHIHFSGCRAVQYGHRDCVTTGNHLSLHVMLYCLCCVWKLGPYGDVFPRLDDTLPFLHTTQMQPGRKFAYR